MSDLSVVVSLPSDSNDLRLRFPYGLTLLRDTRRFFYFFLHSALASEKLRGYSIQGVLNSPPKLRGVLN
jgi:hypothetical protein